MKDQKTEELLYQPEQGINVLQKYMEMFGFHEASGIEITENPPQMADEFPVTAAIGQSNHNYTTTQLARYASVLANHGTLHNLTLISSEEGEEESPNEELNVVSDSTWNVIGEGMKKMADSNPGFIRPFCFICRKNRNSSAEQRPAQSCIVYRICAL